MWRGRRGGDRMARRPSRTRASTPSPRTVQTGSAVRRFADAAAVRRPVRRRRRDDHSSRIGSPDRGADRTSEALDAGATLAAVVASAVIDHRRARRSARSFRRARGATRRARSSRPPPRRAGRGGRCRLTLARRRQRRWGPRRPRDRRARHRRRSPLASVAALIGTRWCSRRLGPRAAARRGSRASRRWAARGASP